MLELDGGKKDDDDSEDSEEEKDNEDDDKADEENQNDDADGGDDDGKFHPCSNYLDDDDDDDDDEEDDKSFLSSSSSNTESDDDKLDNIKDFGKILGYAMLKNTHKEEKMCNCCYVNPCCIKWWNRMDRIAKYYELINIVHNIGIAYLCWNFQAKPQLHVLIMASTQFFFTFWLYFIRPFKSTLNNTVLLLSETFIELFLIGLYLKHLDVISIPDLDDNNLVIKDLYNLEVIQIMAYVFFHTMPTMAFYTTAVGFVLSSVKGLVKFALKMTHKNE